MSERVNSTSKVILNVLSWSHVLIKAVLAFLLIVSIANSIVSIMHLPSSFE